MKKLVLTASMCALLLAGCLAVARRIDTTTRDFWGKAEVNTQSGARGSYRWFSRSRPCSLTVKRIDGKSEESWFGVSGPRHVNPGEHTFVVAVQWSNGWQDQIELTFEAEGGKLYWILTYELALDEPEEKAEIRRYTAAEQTTEVLLSPLAVPLAPVAVGYLGYRGVRKLLGEETKEPATGRPFERCCFVWVQEEESGIVVAGERPGGGTPHQ